jgi:hypothetical protein
MSGRPLGFVSVRGVRPALGAEMRALILKAGLSRSLPYFCGSLKITTLDCRVDDFGGDRLPPRYWHVDCARAARDFDISLVFVGPIVTAAIGIAMCAAFALVELHTRARIVRGPDDVV